MPIPSYEHSPRLGDRNNLIISFALRPHVDIFGFLIPVLVTLVAANVEGTNKPLFEKHGINMWAFLVGLGVYCFALVADINSRMHDHQANSSVIAVVSGSLSTVSLISTLAPQVIGYIILCISWICAAIFIVVVYEDGKLYKGARSWIYKNIMESVLTHMQNNNWFHEASNNNIIISSPSTEQPPPAAISDNI